MCLYCIFVNCMGYASESLDSNPNIYLKLFDFDEMGFIKNQTDIVEVISNMSYETGVPVSNLNVDYIIYSLLNEFCGQ